MVLEGVRRYLLERNPGLQPRHVDFLCAPWVHFFTHSALHRLQTHGSQTQQKAVQEPNASAMQRAPGDTLAFMEFFRTPAYCSYLDQTLDGMPPLPSSRTAIHLLDEQLSVRAHTVAFMSCLSRNFRYLLQFTSLGRIRFLDNKPRGLELAPDLKARVALASQVRETLDRTGLATGEWLSARVAELFPRSLLEYLEANLRDKQARPPRRTLFSADGWQIIDDWKIYALAQKITHGTHWIGAPNAISHGSLAVFWQREFEITHMDRYLTWGWSRTGADHVLPFYSPHFAGQRQARPTRAPAGDGILITSAARPQHLLEFPYTPERFERYLRTQLSLADQAQRLTDRPVTIRTRPRDLGWDLKSMVQRLNNPQVTIEFQAGKFTERLRQSRLHICDNCSTTIAESLWANHPTLVLISEDYFQIRPEAAGDYGALAAAGIFHTSQESLLRQLARLETDLDPWWQASTTQAAIRRFLEGQGRTGSGLRHWKQALLQRTKGA